MKPFVKWVGSKNKVLPHILSRLPDLTDTIYMEPFVGGGSVFSRIPSDKIRAFWLYDLNRELICTYYAIQMYTQEFFESLDILAKAHSFEFFKKIRNQEFNSIPLTAARFVYLNKTCFNGLYRVNKKGQFNTPIGSYKNPKIYDVENLKEWYLFLQSKTRPNQSSSKLLYNFGCKDFRCIHDCFPIASKIFCYCDPPFDGVYSSYTKEGFTQTDHEELLSCLEGRSKTGDFKWMVSNSNTEFIRALYKDYNIEVIPTTKSVKGGHPQKFDEVVIKNY